MGSFQHGPAELREPHSVATTCGYAFAVVHDPVRRDERRYWCLTRRGKEAGWRNPA